MRVLVPVFQKAPCSVQGLHNAVAVFAGGEQGVERSADSRKTGSAALNRVDHREYDLPGRSAAIANNVAN